MRSFLDTNVLVYLADARDARKQGIAEEFVEGAIAIRTATLADAEALAAAEAESFPAAEAATRAQFAERLARYASHFWLMFEGNRLVSFVDGLTTNHPDLMDEMFERAELHDEQGSWQMIFGVVTVPDCRCRGLAGRLLAHVIEAARRQGRKGLVLTCKDALVAYYAKFGFVDEGIGSSVHGGVPWHQMRLTF